MKDKTCKDCHGGGNDLRGSSLNTSQSLIRGVHMAVGRIIKRNRGNKNKKGQFEISVVHERLQEVKRVRLGGHAKI